MRQYAWYSPELNTIILQTLMENCYISFEWSFHDMYEANKLFELNIQKEIANEMDLSQHTAWMPLGEL